MPKITFVVNVTEPQREDEEERGFFCVSRTVTWPTVPRIGEVVVIERTWHEEVLKVQWDYYGAATVELGSRHPDWLEARWSQRFELCERLVAAWASRPWTISGTIWEETL